MKYLMSSILLLTLSYATTIAQGRYDANWAFGYKCGVTFEEDSSISLWEPLTDNFEANATISDSLGQLLLYLANQGNRFSGKHHILDINNNVIVNGDSLNAQSTISNGLMLLPLSNDRYKLVHLDQGPNGSCDGPWCVRLFASTITLSQGVFHVERKNTAISITNITESIVAVKHSNGNNWWLLGRMNATYSGCTDSLFSYLLSSDTIISYPKKKISYQSCEPYDFLGEMKVSRHGNLIAICYPVEHYVELLSFDRCDGSITELDQVVINDFEPYSVAFSTSGKYIYVAGGATSFNNGGLLQYTINTNGQLVNKYTLFEKTDPEMLLGQLERGPNGKIYMISTRDPFDRGHIANTTLSVINYPDSTGASCQLDMFSIPLGDSCINGLGLPNMPNYNQGATSIYQADAGVDTFLCINDTTAKGILIGTESVSGVSYNWLNEDSTNANKFNSKVFVEVDSTTWFYLQLTDTTIQGSCQTRIDSVLVEHRMCTGVGEIDLAQIKVYPNPASDKLNIETPSQGRVELFDLSGRKLLDADLHQGMNEIFIDQQIGAGMFIYKVYVDGQLKFTDKLVITQ